MNVMLSEACAPLSLTARKYDSYSIQNRGLPSVVWTNEDSRITQLNIKVLY